MRWLYSTLLVLFTAAVLLFKFQNIDTVTVSLLNFSATMPLAVLVIGVYVLGMFSGSVLLGLLRSWWRKSQPPGG